MAIDLLQDEVFPAHKYPHDLESFFYVCACAAATYDSYAEQKIRVIPQWDGVDIVKIERNKRPFLLYRHKYDEVFKCASMDFGSSIVDGFLYKSCILCGVVHQSGEAGAFRRNRYLTPEDGKILLS